jgi:hypothetical protein
MTIARIDHGVRRGRIAETRVAEGSDDVSMTGQSPERGAVAMHGILSAQTREYRIRIIDEGWRERIEVYRRIRRSRRLGL